MALHFHRLVLVPWNALTRFRPGGSGRPSARGSIHLPATDRFVCADYVGHNRRDIVHNTAQLRLASCYGCLTASQNSVAQDPRRQASCPTIFSTGGLKASL